jgi:hypothetical protein
MNDRIDLLSKVWADYDMAHIQNDSHINRIAFGIEHNGRFKKPTSVGKKYKVYNRFVFNTSDAMTAFLLTYSDGKHHPCFRSADFHAA